jgi:hypothetical protein
VVCKSTIADTVRAAVRNSCIFALCGLFTAALVDEPHHTTDKVEPTRLRHQRYPWQTLADLPSFWGRLRFVLVSTIPSQQRLVTSCHTRLRDAPLQLEVLLRYHLYRTIRDQTAFRLVNFSKETNSCHMHMIDFTVYDVLKLYKGPPR